MGYHENLFGELSPYVMKHLSWSREHRILNDDEDKRIHLSHPNHVTVLCLLISGHDYIPFHY